MKGITWSRDSHGLFDYESRHLTKRTMKTQDPVQIIRSSNELELLNLKELTQPAPQELEQKPLLNIINDNGKCNSNKWSMIQRLLSIWSYNT
jgi:hypothetical protein